MHDAESRSTAEACCTPLSRDELMGHPNFIAIEKEIAARLIVIHHENPQMSRAMGSYKNWLFSHALFALAKTRAPSDSNSGLTPTNLRRMLNEDLPVSRKTLSSYLEEMRVFGLLERVTNSSDKRINLLKPTQMAEEGMRRWYDGHLLCLDQLDGQQRTALSLKHTDLVFNAQSKMIAAVLKDDEWHDIPTAMNDFLTTESGGILLHHIVTCLPNGPYEDEKIYIGSFSIPKLAEKFSFSASNAKRLFKKSEDDGLLGWELPRRRGLFWVSKQFISDHLRRQAIKFELADRAFCEALQEQG